MLQFFDTYPQLCDADIDQMETKLKFKFPEVYRAHLLKHNGGEPRYPVINFIEDNRPNGTLLHPFLGIKRYEDFYRLEDYFITYKIEAKRMPTSIFPIVPDQGGNCICMDADDGKIYFWDHENEVDYTACDDTMRTNLHFIADTLDAFLDMLYPEGDFEVRFVETHARLTEQDLDYLEAQLNFQFPVAYRGHLLRHNGGKVACPVVHFCKHGRLGHTTVRRFLGITDDAHPRKVANPLTHCGITAQQLAIRFGQRI